MAAICSPALVGSVLFGADEIVIPFVQSRIPYMTDGFGACTSLGVVRHGSLVGGVVYHQYRPDDGDIMVSIAFDRPDWCFPSTLRTLFFYPFVTLGCERITAAIARSNKRSRRLIAGDGKRAGLGFKLEGVARRAFGRRDDAMLYGQLRSECRWLPTQRESDGKKNTVSAAAA